MIVIIGPAKTIKYRNNRFPKLNTYPSFQKETLELVEILRSYDVSGLEKLMNASHKIAELNFERYFNWQDNYSSKNSTPAILGFNGEVFNGLQAETLTEADLQFAQKHLRILSGLYGVLKPNDLILPYRLEMGSKLPNPKGNSLYDYWKGIIPFEIQKESRQFKNNTLINLASNEYAKSINPAKFDGRIITPVFKEEEGGKYKNITVYAKKARGIMLRFIIQNKITNPENIKAFDEEGYYFNTDQSKENEWWFTR